MFRNKVVFLQKLMRDKGLWLRLVFMKEKLLGLILCCVPMGGILVSGCSENRRSVNGQSAEAAEVDSSQTDSLEDIFGESAFTKAADELFDDFIFNFAANSKLQQKRTMFPLPIKENGIERQMKKGEWKMDYFFMKQGYYSLIFDEERQMEIINDTAVRHAVVEKIFLSKDAVREYVFNRIDGIWMLTEINEMPLAQNANAAFLTFYKRFTEDNGYQVQSLHVPVSIILPDPEDDFSNMQADLYPEQWVDFRPQVLPHNIVYNIIYGQQYKNKSQKLFVIRGIANGLETKMLFKNVKGKWWLTKLTKL